MSNAIKLYEDSFLKEFGPGEFPDLKKLAADMEADAQWFPIDGCAFVAIDSPMRVQEILGDPTNLGYSLPNEVLLDTADEENAQLGVNFINDRGVEVMECIGASALPSIYSNVAGLRGDRWNKVPAPDKAGAINHLVPTAGTIIVRKANGKVRAMVSPKYQPMAIPELLQITENLDAYLGTAEFASGFVDHSVTVCKFLYKDIAKDITDAYRDILAMHGRTLSHDAEIIPVVEFRSSDVTNNAAQLLTYLQLAPGHLMPVGEGVRVNHVAPVDFDENGNRKTALQKFKEDSQLIYSRLEFEMNEMLP